MKKKDIITTIIIGIILAAVLFGTIFLTGRRENSSGERALNLNRPIWQNKIIFDYFVAEGFPVGINIINPDVPDVSELPIDLSHFGINTVEKDYLVAGNIDGVYLYFCYWKNGDQFFRYNLITSEIIKIEFETQFEVVSHNFYAHGGYLYYFGWNNPESSSKDYKIIDKYLCRVPSRGGKEEILLPQYKPQSSTEHIIMVEGDTVITSEGTAVYAYDVSDKKSSIIFNTENNDYVYLLFENAFYLNGKLYFLADKDLPSVAEAEEGFNEEWKSPDTYIISLDIGTEKWEQVVEAPVSCFSVSEDRIYYVKKKYRMFYLSEVPITEKDIMPVASDSTVYSCNLGGSDEQVYYMNEKISVNEIFSVKNGKLCGKVAVDYETGYDYDIKLAVIDFSSESIISFAVP